MKLKDKILDIIYGKKCPKCGHRNHSYLLDDNTYSYGVYLHKCDKCGYEYYALT
jgi:DNA-directed RNA polymerase subunit M/transcription elongation factor TFIIS